MRTLPEQPVNSQDKSVRLSDSHLKILREGSGLSDEIIAARGYHTITDEKELIPLGFSSAQRSVPGLLIPGFATDGSNGFCVFRPDFPRQRRSNGKLKDGYIKYEAPKGSSLRLDCPPACRKQLADPSVPLWITEGAKKADELATHSLCTISLNGVYGYKGKNEFNAVTLLADWDLIALKGRGVRIVFDSDVMTKQPVQRALELLTEHLRRKGAIVSHVLPGGRDNKVGPTTTC